MSWWMVMVAVAALLSYLASALLSRLMAGEPMPMLRIPREAPGATIALVGGSVALGWLGASYGAESTLGDWAYLLGALAVAGPWIAVRVAHNRSHA